MRKQKLIILIMVNSNYFKDVIVITFFAVIVVHLVPILCKQNARYGFLQLSASNFEDTVMNGSKDAWIMAVKGAGKISLEKWVELETLLRGMSVRVGIVDSQKDGAFLKRQVREHFNDSEISCIGTGYKSSDVNPITQLAGRGNFSV